MITHRLTIRAENIRPGDFVRGSGEVLWAINDVRRTGYTEVRIAPLDAHKTEFILKTKSVEILRLTVP